jgi:hypothetical protein
MRAFSTLVLGSPHRLPVAVIAANAKPGELYASHVARRVKTDPKEAARLLGDLLDANVLEPAERPAGPAPRGRPRNYLRRCDEEFWDCIQLLGSRYRRPLR